MPMLNTSRQANLKMEVELLKKHNSYLEGVIRSLLSDNEPKRPRGPKSDKPRFPPFKDESDKTIRERRFEQIFDNLAVKKEEVNNLKDYMSSLEADLTDRKEEIFMMTEREKVTDSLLQDKQNEQTTRESLRQKIADMQQQSCSLQVEIDKRHQEVLQCEKKARDNLLRAKRAIETLMADHKTEVDALTKELNLEMNEKALFQNQVVTLEDKIIELEQEIIEQNKKIESIKPMYVIDTVALDKTITQGEKQKSALRVIIANQEKAIVEKDSVIKFENYNLKNIREECSDKGRRIAVLTHHINIHENTINALEKERETLNSKLAHALDSNSAAGNVPVQAVLKENGDMELLRDKTHRQKKEIVHLRELCLENEASWRRFREELQACVDVKHMSKEFDRLFLKMKRCYVDSEKQAEKGSDNAKDLKSELGKLTEEQSDKQLELARKQFEKEGSNLKLTITKLENRIRDLTEIMPHLLRDNQAKTTELQETQCLLEKVAKPASETS